MRVIDNLFEYVISCKCGRKIAYGANEIHNQAFCCPFCKLCHIINGNHPVFTLQKITISYQTEPLKELEEVNV